MKTLTTLITIIFISLLSSPSWSETVSRNDMVWRDGLYYMKFTDVPFTGEVSGKFEGVFEKGEIKNGKRIGIWKFYHKNGQLHLKTELKEEKQVGIYETYHKNGRLDKKGTFKNNKLHGVWKQFDKDGKLRSEKMYSHGIKDGIWTYYDSKGSPTIYYWVNGELIDD